jgi:hypothetical protein
MSESLPINKRIREKIAKFPIEEPVKMFIEDILDFEKENANKEGLRYQEEYKKKVSECIRKLDST